MVSGPAVPISGRSSGLSSWKVRVTSWKTKFSTALNCPPMIQRLYWSLSVRVSPVSLMVKIRSLFWRDTATSA